jgi:hypothetical protein
MPVRYFQILSWKRYEIWVQVCHHTEHFIWGSSVSRDMPEAASVPVTDDGAPLPLQQDLEYFLMGKGQGRTGLAVAVAAARGQWQRQQLAVAAVRGREAAPGLGYASHPPVLHDPQRPPPPTILPLPAATAVVPTWRRDHPQSPAEGFATPDRPGKLPQVQPLQATRW